MKPHGTVHVGDGGTSLMVMLRVMIGRLVVTLPDIGDTDTLPITGWGNCQLLEVVD